MKLEELTKQQIILLTLLVSFVTSIATGIVTVTLLDQAPPGISKTVNRVVERTIERVVPDKQGASVVTKETTVVVKEDELVMESVKNGLKNIVRVYEKQVPPADKKDSNNLEKGSFMGFGIIISEGGMIALDSDSVLEGASYVVLTLDNRMFGINFIDFGANISLAKITANNGEKVVFEAVRISDSSSLNLGQSIIAISGEERSKILSGIISSFIKEPPKVSVAEEKSNTSTAKEKSKTSEEIKEKILVIETTIVPQFSGTPLFNLFGEVIGFGAITQGAVQFIPAENIKNQLKIYENAGTNSPTVKNGI